MKEKRLISSQVIVAKIISDLDLNEDNLRITDIREWIFEGLLKIGAIQQYEHKVQILPVIGHQAQLPCDLYKLGQVAYSTQSDGGWLPMRKATSSFGLHHNNNCNTVNMLIKDDGIIPIVKNLFNIVDDAEALSIINNDKNIRQTLSALINQYTYNSNNGIITNPHKDGTMFSNDLQYTLKSGYINTTMPDGFVKISYYAIYTDNDGMPMIPDLESYKEAIYWYVTMKLMYPKKLKGEISQQDYYDIRNSYNYYRKQAYAEAMLPDEGDIENVLNDWNKLYPTINERDAFYSTLGQEQNLYNQNR